VEEQHGNLFEIRVGPTYRDAVENYRDRMEPWRDAVERTADLMARMNTSTAEVAATVHYTAAELEDQRGRRPTATEVITEVERWKARRKPPLERRAIVEALTVVGLRGWLDVYLDEDAERLIDEFADA
jgi:hypothetical protein